MAYMEASTTSMQDPATSTEVSMYFQKNKRNSVEARDNVHGCNGVRVNMKVNIGLPLSISRRN